MARGRFAAAAAMASALTATAFLAVACSESNPPRPNAVAAAPDAAAADPAITIFERRVADSPRDAGSRAILAHLRIRAFALHGDVADLALAEAAARGAIAIDPANAQAASLLVRALSLLHRDAAAFLTYEQFVATQGGGAYVSEAAACAAFDAGRWSLAEKEADAFPSGAGHAVVMLVRARLDDVRGNSAAAAESARKAARAAVAEGMLPHEIAACDVAAGEMSLRAGRVADARSDFQRAEKSCRAYAPAVGGLADVAVAEGRIDDAERLAREAAALRPAPPELARVERIAALRGDVAAAAGAALALRMACEAHPDVFGADLADAIARAPRAADARADLAHALELIDAAVASRPVPGNHAVRARVLLALGRADEAADAVTEARRMGTATPSILETSARVAIARRDRAAAASAVSALRALHPSFVPADLAKEFPQ